MQSDEIEHQYIAEAHQRIMLCLGKDGLAAPHASAIDPETGSFVIVGAFLDVGGQPSYGYTFDGNGWQPVPKGTWKPVPEWIVNEPHGSNLSYVAMRVLMDHLNAKRNRPPGD